MVWGYLGVGGYKTGANGRNFKEVVSGITFCIDVIAKNHQKHFRHTTTARFIQTGITSKCLRNGTKIIM